MRACPPSTFLNEQRKGQRSFPSVQFDWRCCYHFGQASHPTSACSRITAVPSHVHSCFRLESLFIVVTNVWPYSE